MGNSYAGQLKSSRFEEALHNSIEASLRSSTGDPQPIFTQLYLEPDQYTPNLDGENKQQGWLWLFTAYLNKTKENEPLRNSGIVWLHYIAVSTWLSCDLSCDPHPTPLFPPEIKSKMDLSLRSDAGGHVLINCQSSSGLDEMDDEDESDSSSPPLPYLQAPPPDGCCTMDGTKQTA